MLKDTTDTAITTKTPLQIDTLSKVPKISVKVAIKLDCILPTFHFQLSQDDDASPRNKRSLLNEFEHSWTLALGANSGKSETATYAHEFQILSSREKKNGERKRQNVKNPLADVVILKSK